MRFVIEENAGALHTMTDEAIADAGKWKQRARQLEAALRECITDAGAHCMAHAAVGQITALRTRIQAISDTARDAIAKATS